MNKEEIDYLVECFKKEDYREIFRLAGMIEEYTEDMPDSLLNKLLSTLYQKICDENKEELERMLNSDDDAEYQVAEILIASNKEHVLDILSRIEEYEKISSSDICEFINALGDPEYTKRCIEDKNEQKRLRLDRNKISFLIGKLESNDIMNYIKRREEIGLSNSNVMYLIEHLKDDKMKIEALQYLDDIQYMSVNIKWLVESIKNWTPNMIISVKDYIEEEQLVRVILRDEKIARESGLIATQLELSKEGIGRILRIIDDPEYTKEVLDKYQYVPKESEVQPKFGTLKKEINEEEKIVNIILNLRDLEYTKKCILRMDEIGLNIEDVFYLIEEYNQDTTLINMFFDICDWQEIVKKPKYLTKAIELVKKVQNIEYAQNIINNCDSNLLKTAEIKSLIFAFTQNPTQAEAYLEEREKFNFSSSEVATLIISANDPDYTKKCILRDISSETFSLKESDIVELIISLNEPKYTIELIETGIILNRFTYWVQFS